VRAARLVDRLAAGSGMLEALFRGVDAEQAAWKPAPQEWSLTEVAAHLLDEEREDFRARLELLLSDPGREWPPIDPEGWVAARGYAGRDLGATVDAFVGERRRSVKRLRALVDPDWDATYHHPELGTITAGDLLASWVAHDALHMRQAAGLHYGYAAQLAGAHSASYAGPW
jgi:hypothetical protein